LHTHLTEQSQFGIVAVLQNDAPELPLPPDVDLQNGSAYEQSWAEAAAPLGATIPPEERFIGLSDTEGRDVPTYRRGDPSLASETNVNRSYLIATGHGDLEIDRGSGRRELADAIATESNPLTARVIVNRLWMHVFGRGLVATVDNFGTMGERPTHPELLDYLADRLVHVHAWHLKPMIKEMVVSRTYWMESSDAPVSDATNKWLSTYRMQRLSAESVRDSLLAVAGNLDESLEGESIPVPHRFAGTGSDSGSNDAANGPIDGNRRRSLYLSSRRNYPSIFLEVFDKPSSLSTFGQRDRTSVATQALTMLNDPLVQLQTTIWANATIGSSDRVDDRIVRMFGQAYARSPTITELEDCKAWLTTASPDVSEVDLWSDMAMGLINAKEFIYVP
jgi:hypothetical protein